MPRKPGQRKSPQKRALPEKTKGVVAQVKAGSRFGEDRNPLHSAGILLADSALTCVGTLQATLFRKYANIENGGQPWRQQKTIWK